LRPNKRSERESAFLEEGRKKKQENSLFRRFRARSTLIATSIGQYLSPLIQINAIAGSASPRRQRASVQSSRFRMRVFRFNRTADRGTPRAQP
jgi:hypothetical protein